MFGAAGGAATKGTSSLQWVATKTIVNVWYGYCLWGYRDLV